MSTVSIVYKFLIILCFSIIYFILKDIKYIIKLINILHLYIL